ncbi:hypothetical protein EVJ24_00990 [Exiguobacterium sp. SH1S21]|uniref:hypothetical protein n=1 Tax=Exiguobacterium sp. SH1S21 TaxID=2510953 RepID=UPI00103F76E5|nr:hypothetical protein [Exiguobacterium sp. SH1S21]TCI57383.1 hypothetical protein EVJ24_00990 [Exiguobacterium sp. SH1S21]
MAVYREYVSVFYLDTKRLVDGKEKRQLVRFGPLGARMETEEIKQFGDLLIPLLAVESATYVVSREFHVTV